MFVGTDKRDTGGNVCTRERKRERGFEQFCGRTGDDETVPCTLICMHDLYISNGFLWLASELHKSKNFCMFYQSLCEAVKYGTITFVQNI
jgi:hypothetical protein